MSGEFRGDFSRLPFDPRKGYSALQMQQGRVQLDADWNEQVAILLHTIRTLAEDLIGAHGGPMGEDFLVSEIDYDGGEVTDFKISSGHYYVCGILCDNRFVWDDENQDFTKVDKVTYKKQPFYPSPQDKPFSPEQPLLVYLDVWEREITHLQDAGLREVALGGPDTTTRSQVVWQVKVQPLNNTEGLNNINDCKDVIDKWPELINKWQPAQRGELKVEAKVETLRTEPCTIDPESSYQGPENQLYRVEIHKSGNAGTATFKWSRENGSVVYPIAPNSLPVTGTTAEITLESWWSSEDDPRALKVNDLIEIVNEDYILLQKAEPLWQISEIKPEEKSIKLEIKPEEKSSKLKGQDQDDITPSDITPSVVSKEANKYPMLRRWDGFDPVEESTSPTTGWLPLEDGIKIQFQSNGGSNHDYRTGDYWLIPARVATGDVEWPKLNDDPVALPPHGIRHHYAPLAIIKQDGLDVISLDCRCQFYSLAQTYDFLSNP